MNAPSPSIVRGSIPTHTGAAEREGPAGGTIPESISAGAHPASVEPVEPSAEAQGRRTLSTAYVRVGPDGYMTIELRSGDAVVLRDVVVGAKAFCGVRSPGGTEFCGRYADVAAAAPGGGPIQAEPGSAIADPRVAPSAPARRD